VSFNSASRNESSDYEDSPRVLQIEQVISVAHGLVCLQRQAYVIFFVGRWVFMGRDVSVEVFSAYTRGFG
jgi:hypothetical protein